MLKKSQLIECMTGTEVMIYLVYGGDIKCDVQLASDASAVN